jgi:hypothetical protein
MITYTFRGRGISEWLAHMPAARYKSPVRFSFSVSDLFNILSRFSKQFRMQHKILRYLDTRFKFCEKNTLRSYQHISILKL